MTSDQGREGMSLKAPLRWLPYASRRGVVSTVRGPSSQAVCQTSSFRLSIAEPEDRQGKAEQRLSQVVPNEQKDKEM